VLDSFLDRCHDILELTNTVLQFSRLEQPRASLSFSADIHLDALNRSCERMYSCARSVEMGT
jgi:hypothetical protein